LAETWEEHTSIKKKETEAAPDHCKKSRKVRCGLKCPCAAYETSR